MYEELVKRLRNLSGTDNITEFDEAAYAIEELTKDLERSKEWESFWEKEANEALRKFQVAVANKPRWIPVTERPIDSGWYLVACNEWGGSDVRKAVYDEVAKQWLALARGGLWDITKSVTHWMPLPEPPKEAT